MRRPNPIHNHSPSQHAFPRVARLLLAALLLPTLLAGCGYKHEELFREDVRTVAVHVFENRSFYRGVEFDLAEALTKEVELRTPYKVTDAGGSDTLLEGRITSVRQKQLSRIFEGGVPQEMEVVISVDFVWKELRTGRALRERRGFEAVGRYIPTAPVNEPFEVGQHEAVEQMATEIVSVMRSDW